jgi:hypothetical protein
MYSIGMLGRAIWVFVVNILPEGVRPHVRYSYHTRNLNWLDRIIDIVHRDNALLAI